MPRKLTFCLDIHERQDLMRKILDICRRKLAWHKREGTEFVTIARAAGVRKQRIREIMHSVQIGENTLARLLISGYIEPADLLTLDINDMQRYVVKEICRAHGVMIPEHLDD